MFTFGDVELTKEEFDKMIANSDGFDVEVKTKRDPMEKLNYRFSKAVQKECELISGDYGSLNQSDIARAAIAIGLHQIRSMLAEDKSKAERMVCIGKLRHDLLK